MVFPLDCKAAPLPPRLQARQRRLTEDKPSSPYEPPKGPPLSSSLALCLEQEKAYSVQEIPRNPSAHSAKGRGFRKGRSQDAGCWQPHWSRFNTQVSTCSLCQFPWCKYSHCGHFKLQSDTAGCRLGRGSAAPCYQLLPP